MIIEHLPFSPISHILNRFSRCQCHFGFELENVVVSTYGLNQYGKQTLNWITVHHLIFAYRLRFPPQPCQCNAVPCRETAKCRTSIFGGRTSFNVNCSRYILSNFRFVCKSNSKCGKFTSNHQRLSLPRPRFMQIQCEPIQANSMQSTIV